jgi:hypothetical protein
VSRARWPHDGAAEQEAGVEDVVTVPRPAAEAPREADAGATRATVPARIVRWARRRPVAAAAIFYLVLSCAIFAPGLVPGRTLSASNYLWTSTPWDASRPPQVPALGSNRELTDSVTQYQPAVRTTRAALPHLRLWDPNVLSGRPFIADPQTGVFSVFNFPSYVLPFWWSLALVAALKVFVAAFGAFLLGRLLGMRLPGALLTGLVFGFSLWAVTWQSWPHMSVWAFLPWLCLLSEHCVRRPGPLPFAGLAAVVGLQFFGGHPSSSYQIMFVVGLVWVVRTCVSPELRRGIARRLLVLAGAFAAGTALAAAQLIPFAELLSHSTDQNSRAHIAELLHQPPRFLLGLFLHDYWGHGPTSTGFGFNLVERAYYVGALPVILAATALVTRPTRARAGAAVVGAATLLIATGLTPLYDLVIALPGFAAANNGRFAVVGVLCLALLAGWGLDDLTAGRLTAGRRNAVVVCALAVAVLPVALALSRGQLGGVDNVKGALRVAWGFADPHRVADVVRLASVLEWIVFAACAVVLVALRVRGRLGVTAFVALGLALVVADLFKAGMGYTPAIPVNEARPPVTSAIRFLETRRPERFTGLVPTAPITLALPFAPNLAMSYGAYDARGNVTPTEERYFLMFRDVIGARSDCYFLFCTQTATARPRALRALGVLGVAYLLQNRQDRPLPGLRVAYAGPDARIYRNPQTLPRAFLVDRQAQVPNADAALAVVTDARFPVRTTAVTESPIPGVPRASGAPPRPTGRARIRTYEPERVVIDTDGARRSILVLTDSWYPGWKATVDGKDATVHRVDYLVRGVAVPAGRHRIEFRYEPLSWRVGWIVSLLAGVLIVLAAVVGRRRGVARPATAGSV